MRVELSNTLLTVFFKGVLFLFLGIIVFLVIRGNTDYFLIGLFSFVAIGWIIRGKLFQLVKVEFDKDFIYINDNPNSYDNIQDINYSLIFKCYIKLEGRKYFFMSDPSEILIKTKRKHLNDFWHTNKEKNEN